MTQKIIASFFALTIAFNIHSQEKQPQKMKTLEDQLNSIAAEKTIKIQECNISFKNAQSKGKLKIKTSFDFDLKGIKLEYAKKNGQQKFAVIDIDNSERLFEFDINTNNEALIEDIIQNFKTCVNTCTR